MTARDRLDVLYEELDRITEAYDNGEIDSEDYGLRKFELEADINYAWQDDEEECELYSEYTCRCFDAGIEPMSFEDYNG